MKIAVSIQVLDQIGPYDYRTSTRTKIMDSATATVDEMLAWTKTHGTDFKPSDLSLSIAE